VRADEHPHHASSTLESGQRLPDDGTGGAAEVDRPPRMSRDGRRGGQIAASDGRIGCVARASAVAPRSTNRTTVSPNAFRRWKHVSPVANSTCTAPGVPRARAS